MRGLSKKMGELTGLYTKGDDGKLHPISSWHSGFNTPWSNYVPFEGVVKLTDKCFAEFLKEMIKTLETPVEKRLEETDIADSLNFVASLYRLNQLADNGLYICREVPYYDRIDDVVWEKRE